jgi:hypothetical protein
MAHYIEIEVPYGTKLLIPIHGSEPLMKALFAGQLIEHSWRDGENVAYKAKDKLKATYVEYKVIDRPPPEPETAPEAPSELNA